MTSRTTARTTRTTSRRRRVGVLAAGGAAVLALGLGACGSGDDSASGTSSASSSPATELTAFEAVQASAKQSSEAGSGRFSLTMSGTAEGQALNITGDGAFDAESDAFEMNLTLPAQAGGTALTVRVVDGSAYLSGAPLTAQGQWMELPLDDMGATGIDTTQMDPGKQLEQLQAVADDVREVPATTVRGVQAKGYAGTIDPQKALSLLPAEQRTQEAEEAAAKVDPVPFTLYVDDQNRPVQLSEKITVEGSTADISMDFYDWGSDVDVAVPDPATVTDGPDLSGTSTEAPADAATAGA